MMLCIKVSPCLHVIKLLVLISDRTTSHTALRRERERERERERDGENMNKE